ncbi:MAG: YdcF family protein [Cyanobacteriota bacterium]|nr:YdcF family protein [Cyanobacteriota bacterium]
MSPRRRSWFPNLVVLAAASALIWLSRGFWWHQPPQPQLILVLGGDPAREQMAADLARQRGLPVVVSSGSNPEYAHWLFGQSGMSGDRVHLDYRAYDTLTNFTSVVGDLRQARVRHVLLVTSADHMRRALLVGRIVAGSQGITLTPMAVTCGDQCVREPITKVLGDGARALLWVITGVDFRAVAADWLSRWRR